jgi:hypothetical protein
MTCSAPDVRVPRPAVAIATCTRLPRLDAEGRELMRALRDLDLHVTAAVWNEPHDWARFDAVVLRLTWDYFRMPCRFLAWAHGIGDRLLNPPPMVAWNTDKSYLLDLSGSGIPIVETQYAPPGALYRLPAGQFVVKPAVSAGVNGTATYDQPRIPEARRHISALHAAGRAVLIQPYCHRVDSDAETGVIFIDGQVSHAVRKGPLLRIGQPPESGPWRDEDISPRHPAADVLQLARQAHACAVRRFGTPLYARADVIRDDTGAPRLLELELIEPSLFLQLQPGSATALATALHARLRPRRGQPITERL